MKIKLKFLLVLFIFLSILTPVVNAQTIDNFYAKADNNLKYEEDVNGDSALAGNIVDILGNIEGIGFIAGNTVNVEGDLEYGFIVGQNVTINGNIENSVYIAGSNITISKDAKIGKDTFIVGENIIIEGTLNRHANITATNIVIKEGAQINGNANLDTNKIDIEQDVTITGTLKYNETATANINSNAQINNTEITEETTNVIDTETLLSNILNLIVVFLVISLALPQVIDKTSKIYNKKGLLYYLKYIGIGLLILICIPIICVLLLISSIGAALGLILTGLFIIALYLAYAFAGYLLGELLLLKLLKLNSNKYLTGIIGIALLEILTLIPIIGGIISIIAITIGISTIWLLIKQDEEKSEEKIKEVKKPKSEIHEKSKEIKAKTKVNKNKKE